VMMQDLQKCQVPHPEERDLGRGQTNATWVKTLLRFAKCQVPPPEERDLGRGHTNATWVKTLLRFAKCQVPLAT
jgi:hypothetical protein